MPEVISVIVFFIFMGFIISLGSKKTCPPNTVIIIDRDTHYYKTIRAGNHAKSYRLGPKDVVTSIISKRDTTVQYSNIFVTHDSRYYRIRFFVAYSCENIDDVISALSDSRRSIYDIINNAMSIAVKSLSSSDFRATSTPRITSMVYSQIESMLEPFYIDFKKLVIDSIVMVSDQQGESGLFRKHESQGESPIK